MNYEEENIELSKQLKELSLKINQYKAYFEEYPLTKRKRDFSFSPNRWMLDRTAENYGIFDHVSDSDDYLAYRILCKKYERVKERLSQGKGKRVLTDGAQFVASITPQHVSGKVYKVENGDGCGMFILWFFIIDSIIVMILIALSNN